MSFRERIEEILQAMQRNKLRTLLTAFGVFWGIWMLIILLGAGQGLQNGVQKSTLLDATNSIWFFTQRTSLPYKGLPSGRELEFKEEDLQAIEDNVEGVDVISPENFLWGNYVVKHEDKSGPFIVYGAEHDYFDIKVTQKYTSGRKLNPSDDIQSRKVCTIGDAAVEKLFAPDEDPIGKYVSVKGVMFRIVGVYHFEGYGRWQSQRLYIPFSTFQRVFNPGRSVNLFAVTTEAGFSGKELEQDILRILKQRQIVHPDDNQAYWTHNQEEQHKSIMGLFLGIKSFIWLVGLGTLFSGIVGVSNIMIVLVKERTREIGIRKAVGAKPASIITMIVTESIIVTSIAGYVGLVLGMAMIEGIGFVLEQSGEEIEYFNNPEINLTTAIAAVLILIVAGTLAGFFPALKAARIKPVQALKND
ncbi:MAG: ABC transporter permease [Bacteroidota bacterium]